MVKKSPLGAQYHFIKKHTLTRTYKETAAVCICINVQKLCAYVYIYIYTCLPQPPEKGPYTLSCAYDQVLTKWWVSPNVIICIREPNINWTRGVWNLWKRRIRGNKPDPWEDLNIRLLYRPIITLIYSLNIIPPVVPRDLFFRSFWGSGNVFGLVLRGRRHPRGRALQGCDRREDAA